MKQRQPEYKKIYLESFSKTSGLTIGSNRAVWEDCKKEFYALPDYEYLYVKTGNTIFGSADGWSVGLTHEDVKDLHEYLGQIIQYMEDK